MNLKARSFKQLLLHIGGIIVIAIILILVFFYTYLPYTTNHGETITLPDLEGIHHEEIDEFLTSRNLRYEVRRDSGYSEDFPPFTILNQHPKAGSKVKENRKIYLTLNAENPPLIKMPNLIDGSLKNAEMVLNSLGLEVGDIRYEPDLAENAVLEQHFNGEDIVAGTSIPKGAKVDLVVGDGLGKVVFEMPDIIGMEMEEAKVYLLGLRLKIGSILNKEAEEEQNGIVMQQNPEAGTDIRSGELVDLWIGNLNELDSLNNDEFTSELNDF